MCFENSSYKTGHESTMIDPEEWLAWGYRVSIAEATGQHSDEYSLDWWHSL